MTRDFVSRSSSPQHKTFVVLGDGTRVDEQTWTGSMITHERYRDDIHYGDHIQPTPYKAHRYKSNPARVYTETERGTGYFKRPGDRYYEIYDYVKYLVGDYHAPLTKFGQGDGMADSSAFPDHVEGTAVTMLLNKLNDGDVDLGVLLGEMVESTRMIAEGLITVLQAYRAVRNRNYKQAARVLGVDFSGDLHKNATDTWFALKFGWLPFLSDVFNAHQTIQDAVNKPIHLREKAVFVAEHLATSSNNLCKITRVGNATKGCQVGVSYRIEDRVLQQMSAVGLVNPLLVAWELVPMSFVIDWFMPVSSYLHALSSPLGLQFKHGYATRFAYGQFQYQAIKSGWTQQPEYEVDTFGMYRKVLLDFPKPSLHLNLGLNPGQVLTALGLLRQRL